MRTSYFGVGCSLASTGFGVAMPPGKTIIHATLDPLDLNKDVAVQFGLIGDARLTLTALTQAMEKFNMSTAVGPRGCSPADRRPAHGLDGGMGAKAVQR